MAVYSLRPKVWKDCCALSDVKFPHATRQTQEEAIYAVEIVDRENEMGRVKVHYMYVGYREEYNESKEEGDIIPPAVPGKIKSAYCVVSFM